MDCRALGGLLRSSEIFELPFWVILGYSRAFRVRVGVKKYEMDSLKYTNIEQYYIYYDLTNKPTSRPIRLFVYHLIGLLLVGLSGSKRTMFMNMFVYRTPWSCCISESCPNKTWGEYFRSTAVLLSGPSSPSLRRLSSAAEALRSYPNDVYTEICSIRVSFSTSSQTPCYLSGWHLGSGAYKAPVEHASYQLFVSVWIFVCVVAIAQLIVCAFNIGEEDQTWAQVLPWTLNM
jgi:hypothetical protein